MLESTERYRKVMALANQEAQRLNHERIGPEHILLGLIKEGSGVGATVLKNLGVDLPKIRQTVERLTKSGPDRVTMGRLPLTPTAQKVVDYATKEAQEMDNNHVGTEHLLVGLMEANESLASLVLKDESVQPWAVRKRIFSLMNSPDTPTRDEASPPPRLAETFVAVILTFFVKPEKLFEAVEHCKKLGLIPELYGIYEDAYTMFRVVVPQGTSTNEHNITQNMRDQLSPYNCTLCQQTTGKFVCPPRPDVKPADDSTGGQQ